MRSNNSGRAAAALMLAMACSALAAQPKKTVTPPSGRMVADAPVLLGEPYVVAGTTYTPADPVHYDEVGYAGISDSGSLGKATANGEAFVSSAVGAAHKTLPLPSYVEVTALDSGRTILVRVNDRGPMRGDQVIALSSGAAAQLGVGDGPFPVRVRRVNPPEQERAALRAHGRAADRLETPPALLKALRSKLSARPVAPPSPPQPPIASAAASAPRPGADFDKPTPRLPLKSPLAAPAARPAAPTVATPAGKGGYVVQVGAFSSQERAETLASSMGARAERAGSLWRVRFGPYPTRQAAQAGLRTATAKGFENVRIMANDAR